MISASIKLANLQYFEALQQLALSNLSLVSQKPKLIQLPFYNFVCTFVDIITQFSKTHNLSQNNTQIFNLNSYLVDYYFRKYQQSQNQIYRQLFSFIRSWKKYTEHHQQAKLFVSLLTPQRNTVQAIKQFLKFRKCILKSLNQKIMQELTLTHQDALTITHTLFSHNLEIKIYITKKINEMFISLKRKLVNSAKVNGAVMCQFLMACTQRFNQLDINNLFKQAKRQKQRIIRQPQNLPKSQNRYPLKIKNQNEVQNPQQKRLLNDMKNNLSFSEEFASYYSPKAQIMLQHYGGQKQQENQDNFIQNFQQIQNEWRMKSNQSQAPINLVRNSLTFFKQRDKQIDEKLTNCKIFREHHYQHKHQPQINQKFSYPEGWQNFIRTNELTKKKLMSKNANIFKQIY